MTAYLRALAVIALTTTVAVLVDPAHRATALRVALLALVVLGAVALVQAASRRLPPGTPSPFDPVRPPAPAPVVPTDLARVAADLDLYRSSSGSRLGSGAADRLVRDVVAHRLAVVHGITTGSDAVADRGDDLARDPRVRGLLGPATLAALARRRAAQPEPVDPRTLADELERL